MRLSAKVLGLAVLACSLVVLAGVFSYKALATSITETYCNDCNLGSVPAVSSVHAWTSNHSSTFFAKKQQIYYYINGIESGSVATNFQVFGLNYTGSPSTGTATARCHLLNDGTSLAKCWADR